MNIIGGIAGGFFGFITAMSISTHFSFTPLESIGFVMGIAWLFSTIGMGNSNG